MEEFRDQKGHVIQFSFERNYFTLISKHVLVICEYKNKWLLTNHKIRGLEFPGGKAEQGETLEQAARREVYEETGGVLKRLEFVGEYLVLDPGQPLVKTVFYGEVEKLEEKDGYLETNGPVLFDGNLLESRFDNNFSFIMKDDVVKNSLDKISEIRNG
ncbi:RNA deprotection pyrophosphohydrolase [Bacillus methanolicus]|uniref:Nucleoside triphosphate phosphohydrolase n=1 Tax=Bacillus methanolicus (strain MGA3 / ATCC 53907) TaxID=796606 RepID=I3EC93_BACMM|nr:nucleoside triphosphatase YtkD [Bacillus methanolicus]AIE61111.1 nucleoside triphosphate phosphohydrolase [Bacillus methanolicus MGA3]EIJ84114.1 YtkD [Bacillus methanolicus MGA3]UQD53090.1 nucleoside triphosphatase YtkD [Bacillus methanolicus]